MTVSLIFYGNPIIVFFLKERLVGPEKGRYIDSLCCALFFVEFTGVIL